MSDGSQHDGCGLKKKHGFGDFVFWNLITLLPVGTAGVGVFLVDGLPGLLLFIALFVGLFVSTYFWFFCYRCPHYFKSDGLLKCMFLWGVPRVRKPQPGPYTKTELTVSFAGIALMWTMPFYWLWRLPLVAVFYVLSLTVFMLAITRYECTRCIHFKCPLSDGYKNLKQGQKDGASLAA